MIVVISITALPNHALASCGDIIYRQNYGEGPVEETEPIEDCTNPFNADSPEIFGHELIISGQTVNDGSVISVVEGEQVSVSFEIDKSNNFTDTPLQLFKQEGEDYHQIDLVWDDDIRIDLLPEGEYKAVLIYDLPPIQVKAEPIWKQVIKELFLPQVAYAFFPDSSEVVVISFTVEYTNLEPVGASSILFLPGIQASRLYTDGLIGTENQLWEPNRNDDVDKLAMNDSGESINDIYTRDVIDEIVTGGNIYETFLDQMDELRSGGVIEDFEPFAYDWRHSVFDVATKDIVYENETKRLLHEILALTEESYTGKVTLIAHSNGGLVAKALLNEYGETDLAGKIDKLIMIGTPQLGTPKAIGSLLHGLDQSLGLGLVATANTVRQTTKNMPGAYTLLPSQKYFDEVSEPIITTDGSELAESISAYGDIDSASKLQDLLLDSLQKRDEAVTLNEPIVLNAQMSADATNWQNILDNWQAPEGVDVYEVVGTGLATIKGYEYREYSCQETNPNCILNSYLKPFPIMSNQGDQTVMEISAEGYGGDKVTAVVDLYEASFFKPKNHANLTESDVVQEFIDSVIKYPYLSDSIYVPDYTEVISKYTIIGVHSPVSILATDKQGNQVGIVDDEIKNEVSNSQYFELGDSKYLVLPTEENVEIKLAGTDEGVYSLSVDEVDATGRQKQISLFAGATTSPSMLAEFSINDGVYSSIKTDLDGDGKIDLEQTLDGELIIEPIIEYNYSDLRSAIKDLDLNRKYESGLLFMVKLAEVFSKKAIKKPAFSKLEKLTLKSLEKDLDRYYKRRIISEEDLLQVKKVINNL